MSIEYTFNNKVPRFLIKFNSGKERTLKEIGLKGVDAIKKETPVGETGNLKDGNKYKVSSQRDATIFYNDVEYAPHVVLGTVYQSANPFVTRALRKSDYDFLKIAIKHFKA